MAKRVRLEHDERRALILGAARRLFCTRPYSEVSTGDLADAAGVTRGLLHHYFGSKRDLYLAVVRDVVRVPTLPLPEGADELPAERVWDASVDGWMALIEANKDLWLAVVGAGGAGRDAEVEEILDEAQELVAGRAMQARGIDPDTAPDELRAVVRCYGAVAQELTREWLLRERLTRAQARELLRVALPVMIDQMLPAVLAAR